MFYLSILLDIEKYIHVDIYIVLMTNISILTRKTIIPKNEQQREKEDNSGSNNSIENVPKTTLKIPPDLMLWYKHLALDRNKTVTQLVVEAMREYRKVLER
jgi:hypothetical protein